MDIALWSRQLSEYRIATLAGSNDEIGESTSLEHVASASLVNRAVSIADHEEVAPVRPRRGPFNDRLESSPARGPQRHE
jgi:hypothetical protein